MTSDDRDHMNQYPSSEHGIYIHEFKYWNLYLHPNQCYLGRCYLWAKRLDAIDLMEMLDAEWLELRAIGQNIKKTLDAIFSPDLYNYASLGNTGHHLHIHFIPRYATPRFFQNIQFIDTRWGKNYAPYNKEYFMPLDICQAIAFTIAEILKHSEYKT